MVCCSLILLCFILPKNPRGIVTLFTSLVRAAVILAISVLSSEFSSPNFTLDHRLIKITDRALDVVFSRFISISITITLRQKPKGAMLCPLRVTHLGCCLRVILNKKIINLEKTT